MKIIVGLGNPGEKYKKTRHNAGFLAMDALLGYFRKNGDNFSDFAFEKKYNAEISSGNIDAEKIVLAKPQTFMNDSGKSVSAIMNFYKLNPQNDLLVIYDDVDLPLGAIRNAGESAGGHKGVDSIIKNLGTNQISRVRIGILGKPKNEISNTADYVLENFSDHEFDGIIKNIKNEVIPGIEKFIKKPLIKGGYAKNI